MRNTQVQVIPAKKPKVSSKSVLQTSKRRVAAYARVSTDSEEQLNSYHSQVEYYTNYINSRSDWIFAGLFTDEGISAVNTRRREGFNRMIAEACAGKIDLIITKSVSRFARNTVDSLTNIRKLKEHGTEVYFEKEGIWTFDPSVEILLTVLSSLSQEEARSISENVTWGKRKAMQDGHFGLPWSSFLGYEKGEDGLPKIVPEEAEIVRFIFSLYMNGGTYHSIARELTARGIKTPRGKDKWQPVTVRNILTNETYRGSKRLQKTFCTNYLTKKKKANEGELPMYYIEESHEPIIPPDEFDAVQVEIERRKEMGGAVRSLSPFSSKIICGDCGAYFGKKTWSSNNEKYRRSVWRCNARYETKGQRTCRTSHITEEELEHKFVEAFNELVQNKKSIIDDCKTAQRLLCDTAEIDKQIAEAESERSLVEGIAMQAINDNKRHAVNQTEWLQHNEKYLKRYDELNELIERLEKEKTERLNRSQVIKRFIRRISKESIISSFDVDLWSASVESVTVGIDGKLTFRFKNGAEIKV